MIPKLKFLFVSVYLLLATVSSKAQGGFAYTYSGVPQGSLGDGGLAANAQLSYPNAIVYDKFGNAYINNNSNYKIRKVAPGTTIITTVAGNGTQGDQGDGGQAIAAQLESDDIAVDTLGNIYTVNYNGNRIRKVDVSTGIITTICGNGVSNNSGDGGLAINAEIYHPAHIWVDKENNIYIATEAQIRKIDGQTGTISTYAGTGAVGSAGDGGLAVNAEFNNIRDLCTDINDNLLVVDMWAAAVRRIDRNTGIIEKVIGNGTWGYSGDGGLAINAEVENMGTICIDAVGNMYVGNGNRVRKVNFNTGVITHYAGFSGQQNCQNPEGVPALQLCIWTGIAALANDPFGNLVISDGNRVYRLTANDPVIALSSFGFAMQLYQQCTGPQLTITTPQYVANQTIHTYYGDGSDDVHEITDSYGDGYLSYGHVYDISGIYM